MWPTSVSYAAIAAMAVVFVLLFIEVGRWRSAGELMSKRHRFIRLAAGIVVLMLLALIVIGGSINLSYSLVGLAVYWGACTLLVLVLMLLVMFDVRETLISYGVKRVEMAKKMLEEEQRRQNRQ